MTGSATRAPSEMAPTPMPPPPSSPLPPPPGPTERLRRRLPPWGEPALLAAGVMAACAYTAVVDPNRSSAYPQCPTKMLFGFDCPMCGATRAVHSLLRFDLGGAIDHNLLFVLALPALLYAFVAWTASRMGRPLKPLPLSSAWVMVPLVVVALTFTVVRNVPGPLHWLSSGVN